MLFREDSDVFAFASESELTSSPSDRLGDLEGMVGVVVKMKRWQTPSLWLELEEVLATLSAVVLLNADRCLPTFDLSPPTRHSSK